jgi:hypothetical protein
LPIKDKERKRQVAREWYKKRITSDPSYRLYKLEQQRARYKNPEYRKKQNLLNKLRGREKAKNPEWKIQRNKRRKELYSQNHLLYLLKAVKYRAKKQGLIFSLTSSDLVIPEFCPLLNIPLKKGNNKPDDFSPNIDRINPNEGYTKENCWIISHRANRIKNNASLEELEILTTNLKKKILR